MFRWVTTLGLLVAAGGACVANNPPELLPIGPQTAYVGSRLDLRLVAHDPDGDRLDFSYSSPTLDLAGRARLYNLVGEALFTWTPLATDVGSHQLDFTVSDGDSSDVESVPVTVKAATDPETAPVFRKPLGEGTTLDLAVSKCIKIEILVEDPDSTNVQISQNPPIAGSKIETTGPVSGSFSWCPSPDQISQSIFILRLVADDHDNPVVRKNYTILVRSDLPKNCPGDAPVIVHTPPGPQTTTDAILIAAQVTDDQGLKGTPTVYHTTTKPADPTKLDFGSLSQLGMKPGSSADSYEASLPNPTSSLGPAESATVYYVIVAEDDDDQTGPCDHRTQLPAADVFQVVVTKPTQTTTCTGSDQCKAGEMCEGSQCVKDTCTPQDTDGDKLYWEQSTCPTSHFCPTKGPGTGTSHCALTCSSDSDCEVPGSVCKVFDTKGGCGQPGTKGVGDACHDFIECAGKAMCMPWQGGYCSISDCDSYGGFSGPCPSGSVCVPLQDDRFLLKTHWLCLQVCTDNSSCRASDGYTCKTVTDDQYTSQQVCMQ